ncbi:UPF0182 family protein [uncultured Algimonas sp.]|uniref:UPF0182 family protein n=1 Tax=uncultured Algimonas sp. TaxID=1547920 RepID=UPI002603C939|nr:UPF0182 family protein [uncultured Algimonas sp.]
MSWRPTLAVRGLLYFMVGGITTTLLYWIVGISAFLLAVIFSARFYTDVMWYDSVGYLDVFLTIVKTKIWMGMIPFLLMSFLVATNMILAQKLARTDRIISSDEKRVDRWRRAIAPHTRPVIITIALICGLVFGLEAYPHWETYILWSERVEWGRTDPQFDRDLSYFMFELSLHVLINHWLFMGTLVILLLTLLTSYIFGGIRPQAPHAMLPVQVNLHISAILFCLMALIGWGLLLELHLLSYSERGIITGLGFTDSNASLLAYKFVAGGVILGFVLFQLNVHKPGWILPTAAFIWLFLIGLSVVRFYPNLFQLIIVEPQEMERERPYIEDHLIFTRYGFGLDEVERLNTPGIAEPSPEYVEKYRPVLEKLRLWDPDTLRINFRELQSLRAYFDFHSVDVDRYVIDGETVPVMIAARELNIMNLPEHSRRWQAKHLVYTHGFGLVAASVTNASEAGAPEFLAYDLPTAGEDVLSARNPRLYFGEMSPEYSIVRTDTIELDHPIEGYGFAEYDYDGAAGVPIGSLINRLLFAVRFWDIRLALTTLLDDDSRVLINRDVRTRVQKIAPFLQVDGNPYPAAVDGRIKWIVDAYTTSDMMPYAKRVDLKDLTQVFQPKQDNSGFLPEEFVRTLTGQKKTASYMRGSVKAVVDAYDGTIELYVMDPDDKVLQVWRNVFPEAFRPVSEASQSLRAHFRYPQDLFRIQSVIWSDYHMRSPEAFYTREGAWQIPPDAAFISLRRERAEPSYEQRNKDLRPYWLHTRFPGREEEEFAIVQPFSPEQRNIMAGYLVGGSDGDRYGKLVSYAFPPMSAVIGPAQAQARIDQDPRISAWMTLRMQSGSRVSRGRLIAVPVGDSLIYALPLFVQADKSSVSELLGSQLSSVPELKQVILVLGDRVVMRETLKEAVSALFDETGEATDPADPPADTATTGLIDDTGDAPSGQPEGRPDPNSAQSGTAEDKAGSDGSEKPDSDTSDPKAPETDPSGTDAVEDETSKSDNSKPDNSKTDESKTDESEPNGSGDP